MSTTRSQLYRFARDLGNIEAVEHGKTVSGGYPAVSVIEHRPLHTGDLVRNVPGGLDGRLVAAC